MGKKLTAIDIFCGCGGFSLGLIRAGYEVVCGIDLDYAALTTYYLNLAKPGAKWLGRLPPKRFINKYWDNGKPPTYPVELKKRNITNWKPPCERTVRAVICEDVRNLSGDEILEACGLDSVDVVVGSPPCVSFSRLNARKKPGDPEDYLVFEFARLVEELHPKVFIMENVPEFVSKKLPSGVKIYDVFKRFISKDEMPSGFLSKQLSISTPIPEVGLWERLRKNAGTAYI